MKNLFVNQNNRTIYRGTKMSASVEKEMYTLPTHAQAKIIDRQERSIKNLNRESKTNPCLKWYM